MRERRVHPFIQHLESLRDANDRAALAKLRRGLGKRMGTPEMFPYVVPYLPESAREWEHYFLIASLFGLHHDEAPENASMGTAFRRIQKDSGGGDSTEKRFTNLLSADTADVGGHLRQAVSLARTRRIPVDYHRLLEDLKHWSHPKRPVQLAWARDFWVLERSAADDNQEKGEEV